MSYQISPRILNSLFKAASQLLDSRRPNVVLLTLRLRRGTRSRSTPSCTSRFTTNRSSQIPCSLHLGDLPVKKSTSVGKIQKNVLRSLEGTDVKSLKLISRRRLDISLLPIGLIVKLADLLAAVACVVTSLAALVASDVASTCLRLSFGRGTRSRSTSTRRGTRSRTTSTTTGVSKVK